MSLLDNRTLLCDGEATGNVSGDTNASPTAVTAAAGSTIQGTNATSFQVNDAQEVLVLDQDTAEATFNVDMSDMTVYIAVKQNGGETFANLGGLIVLGDGADGAGTEIIGYAVGGTDIVGLPYEVRYHIYKLDVSVIVATPGTVGVDFFEYDGVNEAGLDQTAILQVGWGSFNLVKAVGTVPNAWFDGFYYIANSTSGITGMAVSIQGGTVGTPETMTDVVGDDVTVGMGLFNNPKGAEYGFFGPTEWGGAAADSYFTATDEQWYFIGDNQGGHEIGATHFPFTFTGDSASTNSFVATRVTIVNTGVRAEFYWDNVDMDFLQWDTCAFVDLGAITGPLNDVDKFANNCTFINCDQIDPSTMDMDGCTVIGTTDVTGAFLWDTADMSANQDNMTFVSSGSGHAINITATGTYNIDGYVFTGFGASATTDASIRNASGGAVTINVSNGLSPTFLNIASATTTIVANVTTTLTGLVNNTEISVYDDGDGSEIAHVENVVGNEFAFSDTAGNLVDIFVHHIEYYRADLIGFTIPAGATDVPVQQLADPNYVNN